MGQLREPYKSYQRQGGQNAASSAPTGRRGCLFPNNEITLSKSEYNRTQGAQLWEQKRAVPENGTVTMPSVTNSAPVAKPPKASNQQNRKRRRKNARKARYLKNLKIRNEKKRLKNQQLNTVLLYLRIVLSVVVVGTAIGVAAYLLLTQNLDLLIEFLIGLLGRV